MNRKIVVALTLIATQTISAAEPLPTPSPRIRHYCIRPSLTLLKAAKLELEGILAKKARTCATLSIDITTAYEQANATALVLHNPNRSSSSIADPRSSTPPEEWRELLDAFKNKNPELFLWKR